MELSSLPRETALLSWTLDWDKPLSLNKTEIVLQAIVWEVSRRTDILITKTKECGLSEDGINSQCSANTSSLPLTPIRILLIQPPVFAFESPWLFLSSGTRFWFLPGSVLPKLQFLRPQINFSCFFHFMPLICWQMEFEPRQKVYF